MSTRRLLIALAALPLAVACGGQPAADDGLAEQESALSSENGLSTNGLSTNGLSTNGLSTNGLSTNGLSTNGLSTNAFQAWFAQDPAYANVLMRYIARCALPAGTSLDYSSDGVDYSWPGTLGLAPGWSAGAPIETVEQEVISACLAAHANKYGVEVAISVRGKDASGEDVPVTEEEEESFTVDEGCFFGNLFDGSGLFAAYSNRSPLASPRYTSLRACAASGGAFGSCPSLTSLHVPAQAACSDGSVGEGYEACAAGGRWYHPVCVRLQRSQINACGDGVCQGTERCGNRWTGAGCAADCGSCR